MAAISNRQPECYVHYDSKAGKRLSRHFVNAYTARRFYCQQDKLGHNPRVTKDPLPRSTVMSTATTTATKTASKKSSTKATASKPKRKVAKRKTAGKAAKAPAKGKAPKAAANGKAPKSEVSAVMLETLKALKDGRERTSKEVAAKTGRAKDNKLRELRDLDMVKFKDLEGIRGLSFEITAKGKKALEKTAK